MNGPWSSWLDLSADVARLSHEASDVIGLRIEVASRGGPGAHAELCRMFSEKAVAAVEAQLVVAGSVLIGEAHLAPARTLALYRQRVQANRRRLTKNI